MQEASEAFEGAVTKASVIWVPTVEVDWASNGFGGAGTIDDLSTLSDGIAIVQSMDDGTPDEVALLNNSGIPAASARLAGGRASDGRTPLTPVQYWSPFNPNSPLYGLDRDIGPAQIEQGVITEDGPESVRIFTGRVADTPIAGGRASLQAISQTRADLSLPILLPVKAWLSNSWDIAHGLNATWPITFTLYQCGVHAIPPPQDGITLWMPLHGSLHPFAPSAYFYLFDGAGFQLDAADASSMGVPITILDQFHNPEVMRGPYAGAIFGEVTSERVTGWWYSATGTAEPLPVGLGLAEGFEDWLTTASNEGRAEFWVRGDAFDMSIASGADSIFRWFYHGVDAVVAAGFLNGISVKDDLENVVCGVDNNRMLFVRINDDTNVHLFTSTLELPEDGEWHYLGFAYSFDDSKAWCYLDGTQQSQVFSAPAVTTANLPTTPPNGTAINLGMALPSAEVHITTGPLANPDTGNDWLEPYDRSLLRAEVYPSSIELVVLAETAPREAWQIIDGFSKGEFAAVSIDENDRFHYRPRGWFATEEGQTVVETMGTNYQADTPEVVQDNTKIRTVARVSYPETSLGRSDIYTVATYNVAHEIRPGTTLLTIGVEAISDISDLSVGAFGFFTLTENQLNGIDTVPHVSPGYVTLNDSLDGTGTYALDLEANGLEVNVATWSPTSVTVRFVNTGFTTWFLSNDSTENIAALTIIGRKIFVSQLSVVEEYTPAVALRGERGITVSLPALQGEREARLAARRLLGDLAYPRPIVRSMEVFGDPRRQPGDLIQLDDTNETGISERFWVHAVRHSINGGDYRQNLQAVKARPVGVWGESVWGTDYLWAGEEAVTP